MWIMISNLLDIDYIHGGIHNCLYKIEFYLLDEIYDIQTISLITHTLHDI